MGGKPSFIDKVNFITDSWQDDCSADAFVYVETLLPVLKDAALSWFQLDVNQIARTRLKPTKTRFGTHSFKKGKGRKFRISKDSKVGRIAELIADPSEFLGRVLQTPVELLKPEIAAPTKFIFKVGGKFLLLGQWMFIAELAFDSLYEWTSLIQQAKTCPLTPNGANNGLHLGFQFTINPSGSDATCSCNNKVKVASLGTDAPNASVNHGVKVNGFFFCKLKNPSLSAGVVVTAQLWTTTSGGHFLRNIGAGTATSDNSGTLTINYTEDASEGLRVKLVTNGGTCQAHDTAGSISLAQ